MRSTGRFCDFALLLAVIGPGVAEAAEPRTTEYREHARLEAVSTRKCCENRSTQTEELTASARLECRLSCRQSDRYDYSPRDALAKMRVPAGFQVKLFAAEPDLVNPLAMTFDERGRVWVAESIEYPRLTPGKGRDRIKILSDTQGTGRADKVTVFADGLNMPSGLALGYGGLFVLNAPDLLFFRDTDGDDRADTCEVLLTGFGREDMHEVPNSLTWGPDGWLYGLNGVLNSSTVQNQGQTHHFNCAVWRYHPRTRRFEVFAEGTSNPWGLDFDGAGQFFVSACVIDHLWHMTETGYYHRQAGRYPPFTWKIESIVQHEHQKAAYAGLCIYQATTYPEEYRDRFFMGNVHGNCLNSDAVERKGASYFATARPDLLTANDGWFMPIVEKVGPDGCIWVLDWYDRYHCYQEAVRDPAGVDRRKGRLYRITYHHSPMARPFDLSKLSDGELLSLLKHDNVYFRRTARQLLVERGGNTQALERQVLDEVASTTARTEAMWTLVSIGPLRSAFHLTVLDHSDPTIRAWAVRAAGNMAIVEPAVRNKVQSLARDASPDVRLQVAIAARKIQGNASLPVLMEILAGSGTDPSELLPRIAWRNLEPLLETESAALVDWLDTHETAESPVIAGMMTRFIERVLAARNVSQKSLFALFNRVLEGGHRDPTLASRCLECLLNKALSRDFDASTLVDFRRRYVDQLTRMAAANQDDPRALPSLGFLVLFGDSSAQERALRLVRDVTTPASGRAALAGALLQTRLSDSLPIVVGQVLGDAAFEETQRDILGSLAAVNSPRVPVEILRHYAELRPSLRPRAIDLLTSRPAWVRLLLDAIKAQKIASVEVNLVQVRTIFQMKDPDLSARAEQIWGKVRAQRNPDRENVVARMKGVLAASTGNPKLGEQVFRNVCAQCHVIHGFGNMVGPDLTNNGRNTLDLLLSNVLDPNQVIGKEYLAYLVETTNGRLISGLLVENSPQRVVLKVPGGKTEVIPRAEVSEMQASAISLMPEGLEQHMTQQEFVDLIAYLQVDVQRK